MRGPTGSREVRDRSRDFLSHVPPTNLLHEPVLLCIALLPLTPYERAKGSNATGVQNGRIKIFPRKKVLICVGCLIFFPLLLFICLFILHVFAFYFSSVSHFFRVTMTVVWSMCCVITDVSFFNFYFNSCLLSLRTVSKQQSRRVYRRYEKSFFFFSFSRKSVRLRLSEFFKKYYV